MKLEEYQEAKYNMVKGGLTEQKMSSVLVDIVWFLDETASILFKKTGEYNKLKWHSIGRWIRLGRLAIKLFQSITKIFKQ